MLRVLEYFILYYHAAFSRKLVLIKVRICIMLLHVKSRHLKVLRSVLGIITCTYNLSQLYFKHKTLRCVGLSTNK